MRSPSEPTNREPRSRGACIALSALLFASTASPQSGTQLSDANPAKSAQFAEESMAPKTRKAIAARAADKVEQKKQVQLPFVVDMKRPALSRVESSASYGNRRRWLS
jgi:hypothetical protein